MVCHLLTSTIKCLHAPAFVWQGCQIILRNSLQKYRLFIRLAFLFLALALRFLIWLNMFHVHSQILAVGCSFLLIGLVMPKKPLTAHWFGLRDSLTYIALLSKSDSVQYDQIV